LGETVKIAVKPPFFESNLMKLFAVLDDVTLRIKIVQLEQAVWRESFSHRLTPYNASCETYVLPLSRTDTDLCVSRLTLSSGSIFLWRTGWAVSHKNDWIHILDSDERDSIPGNYEFICLGKNQLAVREQKERRISMGLCDMPIPPKPAQLVIPAFVAEIMKRDAMASSASCPISLELLNDSVAITSCFHLFESKSIHTWIQRDSSCPVCKAQVAFVQEIV
jgi:hypothetical protein